ncbi:MAG TPA: hypothetical protein VIX87_13465, partial [Steroidobacteraceae bacterium]
TGNLDAALASEVMDLFRRFNEVGVTVVVATHDQHLVRGSGRRQIVLADGHLATADARLPDNTLPDLGLPFIEARR